MGSGGGIVEVDETYFGQVAERTPSPKRRASPDTKGGKSGPSGKRAVIALVERTDAGSNVRAFHVATADSETVADIVRDNIAREAILVTDESRLYTRVGHEFAGHETVNHSAKEYVRGKAHTNTVENYFLTFKRGMRGVYQHCAEKNLHRYLAEFEFRYNTRDITDGERSVLAVRDGGGTRLTYRQPH